MLFKGKDGLLIRAQGAWISDDEIADVLHDAHQTTLAAGMHYSVLTQYDRHAHIRCQLETGRTHQIRVHMKHIGHPIYGDAVYGKAERGIDGQCLHAYKLGFIHPITYEYMEWTGELPQYFRNVLERVRTDAS